MQAPFARADGGDPSIPLTNLSIVQTQIDSLQKFLSDSINTNTLLSQPQMNIVSSQISSAIHQIIINGAALLSSTSSQPDPNLDPEQVDHDSSNVIELDAVELLAEHVHFCEICGKGFKRDANLRMHMRAHGNQFKTPEALSKPPDNPKLPADLRNNNNNTRFSCPYVGCNRNKKHEKFKPLKSGICVKNHFKRSHCPKMYSCNRCNKKSYSVLADLKSHLKHCGVESKWLCSCGTSFSRKDKLFRHLALFEGHMPAVVKEEEDDGSLDELLDGFDSIDKYFCFEDMLNSSNTVNTKVDSGRDEFFNFQ